MALANFFDKSALAASQILQGYDKKEFEQRLEAVAIEVAFDSNAVAHPEGRNTLDLLTRLLARLYPNVYFTELGETSSGHAEKLAELSKSINPAISLDKSTPFATIVVGSTLIVRERLRFYVGSDNWTVFFSSRKPVGSGRSPYPFAAGAAACFAAANLFRAVFKDQLPNGALDDDFALSLVNFQTNQAPDAIIPCDKQVVLGELFLVGLGAIGNGTLWALSKIKLTESLIHIIDPEQVELSNLQRYVLATQEDVGFDKIRLCARYGTNGVFQPFKGSWAEFVVTRNNWYLPLVALAVDSSADRIAVQSSLPSVIINAWTQPADLGVSRHYNFLEQPCVGCLYPPKTGLHSKSVVIARALGLPHKEMEIRELIYNGTPLDETWLNDIAAAKQISFDDLKKYIGMPVAIFYSKVLCGGLLTTTEQQRQVETPMAFQSALAGIILASEVFLYKSGQRDERMETMTRLDLLRTLTEYLNEPLQKTDQDCICKDPDFLEQYTVKYIR